MEIYQGCYEMSNIFPPVSSAFFFFDSFSLALMFASALLQYCVSLGTLEGKVWCGNW
jgi:hypothetical protein